MASHGYSNYRGRKSVGKTVLAVVLGLVTIAAIGFIFLQEKIIFFDETGTAYFRLPGQEAETEEMPQEDVDLTIQPLEEKQETREVRGFNAPVPLDRETWALTYQQAEEVFEEGCNTVAITLKDHSGNIHFDSVHALPGTVRFLEEDTDVALRAALSSSLHTVARISCFHDPKAANREVEAMGLMNTGGFIFYDGNNSQWLDPAKPAAREYLKALACEAAAMGFDEILLADLSYPTEGKLDKIAYGDVDRAEMLNTFLTELRTALEPYSVMLSVEVPETVILQGEDENAGLYLDGLGKRVDCIYAATIPERAETLADAVTAVEGAEFVPMLETYAEGVADSCLIF